MLRELSHLLISAIVLSIAFGIALSDGLSAFKDTQLLFTSIWISFIAVALGFVSHEMAHRIMARKYGFSASYYMSVIGLGIALAVSLTGWIFAAPGGVRIYKNPNTEGPVIDDIKALGKISVAGPLANILLVPAFFIFGLVVALIEAVSGEEPILWNIALFGMQINAWLAFFNMLPFGPLDGRDVYKWNKAVWVIVTLLAVGLYVFSII